MFGYQTALLLTATIIIPCLVGGINYLKLTTPGKLIVALLAFGSLMELLMFILPYLEINNLHILHIYAPLEIFLFSLFFSEQIKSYKEKRMIRISTAIILAFAVVYSIIGNNIAEFNSLPRAIECIYFSVLSSYAFYQISINQEPVNESIFIFNGTIMFYFTSCFLIFTFSKYKAPNNAELLVMYNVHSIVNAICNLSFATGLWIASKSSYSVA